MSATPPEASTEYSREIEGSRDGSARRSGRDSAARRDDRPAHGGALGAAVLGTAMLGALLLLVAEFTTLFEVRTAGAGAVRSVGTGSHDGYALVPLAVLAAAFGYAVWAAASRPALLGIGALGVLALLICLLGDLPDASANGLVFVNSQYVTARSAPSAGFYMETLGAAILMITCVSGLLLAGAPREQRPRPSPAEAA